MARDAGPWANAQRPLSRREVRSADALYQCKAASKLAAQLLRHAHEHAHTVLKHVAWGLTLRMLYLKRATSY